MKPQPINYFLLFVSVIIAASCGQKQSRPNAIPEVAQKTEVEILSLLKIDDKNDSFQLIFGVKKDTTLQIAMSVGKYEAQALAITLEKIRPAVPLPLDVLEEAFKKMGYTVKEVIIDGLIKNVYTSRIVCAANGRTIDFIARVVDATTIAVKFDAPIFVKKDLLRY